MASENQNILVPPLNLLLQNKKFEIKAEMNCVAVGYITAVNSDQTVNVSVAYLRVISGGTTDPNNPENVNDRQLPYPEILKCPLMILSGGNSYLTFPVAKGDSCVIFFNDRDLDAWWQSGSFDVAPNSNRVHDLNDALVFVGARSAQNPVPVYNPNGPQLTNGSNFIAIEDKVKVAVGLVTLGAALDALMTALLTWVDTRGDTPNAATMANLTAAKTLIDTVLK